MYGIDVSSHQGIINWDKVKSQVDFAILRCGYGDNIVSQDDTQFLNNVTGCISNEIPFGVYLYSYAKNFNGKASIQSEIEHCRRVLSQIPVKPFCVYIDMEADDTKYLGKSILSNFALEFCKQITNMGYKAGVYANENWFQNYLDASEIVGYGYTIWCAKYSSSKPNIDADYDIWQYSSTGVVDGIIGNVDMNVMVNDLLDSRGDHSAMPSNIVNAFYRVKTQAHGWLPEVKNLENYAGYQNSPITGLAIRVDKGSIKYRVHIKGKKWLGYVTGYDINDISNGYAGNGKDSIDAVEVYYYTPDEIRPYKKAKYRVNNYSWQYDQEKINGQDGYAGKFGVNVTKFQIVIE